MDKIDHHIIRILVDDAQTPNTRLAKAVGLSESATLERVRRLRASGVIRGFTALVEPADVGRGLEVFMTFTLRLQAVEDVRRFAQALASMPEVLSCAQVLGRFDFVAHVALRDATGLDDFTQRLVPWGVIDRMESHTVVKTIQRWRPPLPLDEDETS